MRWLWLLGALACGSAPATRAAAPPATQPPPRVGLIPGPEKRVEPVIPKDFEELYIRCQTDAEGGCEQLGMAIELDYLRGRRLKPWHIPRAAEACERHTRPCATLHKLLRDAGRRAEAVEVARGGCERGNLYLCGEWLRGAAPASPEFEAARQLALDACQAGSGSACLAYGEIGDPPGRLRYVVTGCRHELDDGYLGPACAAALHELRTAGGLEAHDCLERLLHAPPRTPDVDACLDRLLR
jgi:hypothetical protein